MGPARRWAIDAREDRGPSGVVAACALALLIVLIFTMSTNGVLVTPEIGVHFGITR